jgi:hypothetical protein
MMRPILALLLSAGALDAQTQYLRYGAPEQHHIVGVSNSSPAVIQVENPSVGGGANGTAGLSAGMVVDIRSVCANTNLPSQANGLRKIKAVIDASHYSITDMAGLDIDTTAYTWCDGHAGSSPNYTNQTGSVMLPYTLTSGPRGLLDGTNGPVMRKIALSTNNGLLSLIVSANIATVTTSYNHGLTPGDKVSVWNTASSSISPALTGGEYTITVTSPATFTFPVTVADNDYTHNDRCGPGSTPSEAIQGTDNCVVISQYAVSTNPWYTANNGLLGMQTAANLYNTTSYDQPGLGGFVANTDGAFIENNVMTATKFLIDRTNFDLLNSCVFAANHFERALGVNFLINETVTQGGESSADQLFSSYGPLGMIWNACGMYLTSTHATVFKNKLYDSRNNPGAACTPDIAVGYGEVFPRSHNTTILASGTAQAGDATHLTLAAGDSAANGFYVNNVIVAVTSGDPSYGLVAAYNSTTKQATVTGWDSTVPTAGSTYKIYATITRSGTTITGYNTKFQTDADTRARLAPGDALMGFNRWNQQWPYAQSYIQGGHSTIDSDTQLSLVRNNILVSAGTTPSIYWFDKAWSNSTNDCGMLDFNNYFSAASTFQSLYPPNGGAHRDPGSTNNGLDYGSNNNLATAVGRLTVDLALADVDARASQDAADFSAQLTDYNLGLDLQLISGPQNDGNNYGFSRLATYLPDAIWLMENSVSGYPSLGPTSPWVNGQSIMKMFDSQPDLPAGAGNSRKAGRFGSQSFDNRLQAGVASGFARDGAMTLAPSSATAEFYKSFWPAILAPFGLSAVDSGQYADGFIKIDPRGASVDYTTQPTQYYFHDTDPATATALAGKAWPTRYTQDMMISRGDWDLTQCTPTCSGGTGHWLSFEARTFLQDHDNKQMGRWCLYKVGYLICADDMYPGATTGIGIGDAVFPTGNDSIVDPTAIEDVIRFGGADTLISGIGASPPPNTPEATMPRFAKANVGTLGANYGDKDSKYAYAMADLTPSYLGSPNHVYRHLADMKKSGAENVIFDFVDIDLPSPLPIQVAYNYNQNGNTLAEMSNLYTEPYLEGLTTCPGAHGCAGLDTDRSTDGILSQQSGAAADNLGPARTNAVNSKFFSPGTVFVQDDNAPLTVSGITAANPAVITAPGHGLTVGTNVQIQLYRGGGAWDAINGIRNVHVTDANTLTMTASSAGFAASWGGTASYTTVGAQGLAHRVRVCGGSSCGAPVTGMESLSVHKVCSSLTCALAATALNPDANWTGAQTTDKVVLFARHGQTYSTIAGFTTTHTGTAQYLFAGFTPGTYAITINGSPVTGSPFTVSANDNTTPVFESASGVVSINGSVSGGATAAAPLTSAGSLSSGVWH